MYGLYKKEVSFVFNGRHLNPNDESKIGNIFHNFSRITCFNNFLETGAYKIIGKPIIAKAKINEKIIEIKIGTLNSTTSLFDLNYGFGSYQKDID